MAAPLFSGAPDWYLFGMRLTFILMLLGSVVAALGAQQANLPNQKTAEAARELLRPGTTVRLFCDPCGDRYVQELRVVSVEIEEHPEENNPRWILRVNGGTLPPEEIYIRREGEWRNLAHLLGIGDEETPETIYPFLRARAVPPR